MIKDSEFEALKLAMEGLKEIALSGEAEAVKLANQTLDRIDAVLDNQADASYDCE
ncbi:hypothetical protein [Lactococcus termiticola]|uniref:Uncharacterized protein n=1 Tax=Lactococcus termiticola TaxID=2169526 RepID=A0A2R5HFX4_9LACT|nr:hypothetical protein [Lactococcus termiticola]GBG96914.1 hypothetical protein NtB2_01049 [Lactococcus termiticola]